MKIEEKREKCDNLFVQGLKDRAVAVHAHFYKKQKRLHTSMFFKSTKSKRARTYLYIYIYDI